MKDAFLTLGRGVGQVMFQNNALSGVLMLAGILLNSWQMALLAIAGNVVSTLTACLSGYSREDIRNGLPYVPFREWYLLSPESACGQSAWRNWAIRNRNRTYR